MATTEKPAAKTERAVLPLGPAVRLNTFQILMRRWRSLHPYNAGQAMRVSGPADVVRWQQAVELVIGELGLGVPTINDRRRLVRYRPVEEIPVEVHGGDFQTYVSDELNRPFTDGEIPIRFTVLPQPDGSHLLVAIYDHWIADSRAMRELMHRIFERYRSPDAPTSLPHLTLHAPHFNKLFRRHIGYLYRSRAIAESIRNVYRHRRAYRFRLKDCYDFSSRMIYTPLPVGLISRVHAFAKLHDSSVNDVFLAVMARTTGDFSAPDRYRQRKRKGHYCRDQVGLGTIVDIRDAARQPLDKVFGLYLSSYTVVVERPEERETSELARVIAERTRQIKQTDGAVKAYTALMFTRWAWDSYAMFGFGHLGGQIVHRHVPVTAGISNVNMTNSWVDNPTDIHLPSDPSPAVLDYLRISPTGPLLPLVYTLTTIRDRLSLCCTYRTAAFTEAQAQELVADFIRRLNTIVV